MALTYLWWVVHSNTWDHPLWWCSETPPTPYDGPYPIVKWTDKHFTIAFNGRNDTVSINRLKPAHLDIDNSNSNPQMKELLPNELSNHTTTTHPTPQSHSQPSPLQPHSQTTPWTICSGRRVHSSKTLGGSDVVNLFTLNFCNTWFLPLSNFCSHGFSVFVQIT